MYPERKPEWKSERRDPVLTRPMDVLEQFPVRKSKKRKRKFRQEAARLLESYGLYLP